MGADPPRGQVTADSTATGTASHAMGTEHKSRNVQENAEVEGKGVRAPRRGCSGPSSGCWLGLRRICPALWAQTQCP